MTNYHVILDNKKINITINNENILDTININENNKIYSSIRYEYDIMIIKLDKEKDTYHYLELDDNLFNDNSEDLYKEKSIYILHYPKDGNISVSYGYGIQKDNEYNIKHLCNTNFCSSGSPILNLTTNKVIGIHSGYINKKSGANNKTSKKENQYNIGTLLKYPLKQINEIKLEVKINKGDINKDIYFLDNTDYTDNKGKKHYHDNLKELNSRNTELYINGKKYEYKKYFKPDKEGIYRIQLKFNTNIKDCSHMFHNCYNITNIDFPSFNTENINDISYMFSYCDSLKSLPDISKWDTKNVKDMSYMFSMCKSLESLPDISKWDIKNADKKKDMFFGCTSLKNIPDKYK
jgi:surface protein